MISMLNAIIDSGGKTEAWFFFGVRNRADHLFKDYLQQAAARHENLRLHVCYSRPEKTDVIGRDYQHSGRVTADLFKQLLPSNNYDFFLCGPGASMSSIAGGLTAWGVPEKNIHYEAFGEDTVQENGRAAQSHRNRPALQAQDHLQPPGRDLALESGRLLPP